MSMDAKGVAKRQTTRHNSKPTVRSRDLDDCVVAPFVRTPRLSHPCSGTCHPRRKKSIHGVRIVRITNFRTGESYVKKRRRRFDEPGQARELTFSCYRRFQFLARDRTRQWFVEEMEAARREFPIDLWAYVIMPEHVHMLVYPREPGVKVGVVEGASRRKSLAGPSSSSRNTRRNGFPGSRSTKASASGAASGSRAAATIATWSSYRRCSR